MPASHFEFAVVGGGKGGKTLAAKMASAGHPVVMIEKGMIGGTCINVACIPTKTMVKSAKVADVLRRASDFGIGVTPEHAKLIDVRERKRAVVGEMVRRNQANFDRSGMTLMLGTARFTGPRALDVSLNDGRVLSVTADKIFVNTGTRPALPALPGLAEAKPLDSESIQELDRLPGHLIIIGGGYVGCEFAQMFRRFGSRVTIVERAETFLPREDRDVADQVLRIFQDDGIDVRLGSSVRDVGGVNGQLVRVGVTSSLGEGVIEGSHLLIAAGRMPNTQDLDLELAGIETDDRGFITVNDRLETTAPNVWALGDVNGGPQFTHSSLDDWRIVSANLAGEHRSTSDRIVPYTLFIDPELGRIGLTEAEARGRGLRVRVGRLAAAKIPRAMTSGETRGYLKVVVNGDTGRVLGASILAAGGGEVMSVIQVAMHAGLAYTALRDMMFAHPTMSEGLNDLLDQLE